MRSGKQEAGLSAKGEQPARGAAGRREGKVDRALQEEDVGCDYLVAGRTSHLSVLHRYSPSGLYYIILHGYDLVRFNDLQQNSSPSSAHLPSSQSEGQHTRQTLRAAMSQTSGDNTRCPQLLLPFIFKITEQKKSQVA